MLVDSTIDPSIISRYIPNSHALLANSLAGQNDSWGVVASFRDATEGRDVAVKRVPKHPEVHKMPPELNLWFGGSPILGTHEMDKDLSGKYGWVENYEGNEPTVWVWTLLVQQ